MKKSIFYKVEEVASMLQVNKMTIYRYIKAKRIKALKLGKEIRIESVDLEAFLKSVKN